MSLINKMLQDLDKRHAADGAGKTLTQQLRPVQTRKGWQRILWEVGIGLIIGIGWTAWVLYQVSPRSVVTDMIFKSQIRRPQLALAPAPPAAPIVPVPAAAPQVPPEVATTLPAPAAAPIVPAPAAAPQLPSEAATPPPAPVMPATMPTEAVNIDMLKLATEITTPFKEKSVAKPRPKRKPAAVVARAPSRVADKANKVAEPQAAETLGEAGIEKRAHVQTPAERAEMEFQKATQLLNQGRVAEAMDGYKASLEQDPGHAMARQTLVGLLLENRRIDEAHQFLEEGLSLNPDQSAYAMLLARIQVERGDLQGAHELLRKHAGSARNDADYHAFDAAVLQRLGRHKEAVAGYQQALKLAPRVGLWWMGMGISLQADERNAEALQAYQRAKAVGGLGPPLIAFVDLRMKQLR